MLPGHIKSALINTALTAFVTLSVTCIANADDAFYGSPDRAQAPDLIVIGHRGAAGFRPEHTLGSYREAIREGADFIEPDLVVTKDGVLIARHEPNIGDTTDVSEHPEFADRRTTKVIDGVEIADDWFAEDFTLEEIKTLRARERIPEVRPENTRFNSQFEILTLVEVIDLVKRVEELTGKQIGIYPETKHPTYFAQEGTFLDGTPIDMSLGQKLVDTLAAEDFTDPSRIFIQSFEFANLIELENRIMPAAGVDLPLVQLYGGVTVPPEAAFDQPYDMTFNAREGNDLESIYGELASIVDITEKTGYGDLISPEAIDFIADAYAEGMGPFKGSFLLREPLEEPVDTNGDGVAEVTTQLTGEVRPFLSSAIDAGLLIHPYTLRAEEQFLTLQVNGTPQTVVGEAVQLLSLGVHGFFIDQPVKGVKARDLFLRINDAEDADSY